MGLRSTSHKDQVARGRGAFVFLSCEQLDAWNMGMIEEQGKTTHPALTNFHTLHELDDKFQM